MVKKFKERGGVLDLRRKRYSMTLCLCPLLRRSIYLNINILKWV